MRIAVLGTGSVGQALAGRLDELGHDVSMGTRDPAATLGRTGTDQTGAPAPADWLREHPDVELRTYTEAASSAEVVVAAVSGSAVLAVLGEIGDDVLAGRVLVDITNPLDFSAGFPPTLFVKDDDSLAEQVQRTFPRARVVKTLNTMAAHLMVRPQQLADGDHSVFVSGDDPVAKAVVTELLTAMGHTDVVDLGGLDTARGTEMLLPVWLRLWGALGTATFNLKVVR